jgi:hypothetical protein
MINVERLRSAYEAAKYVPGEDYPIVPHKINTFMRIVGEILANETPDQKPSKMKADMLQSIDQQIELLNYHSGDHSEVFVERASSIQYFVLKNLRLNELADVRDFVQSFYP